ncbi:cyclic nucleotide-gated ion channel 1-like [Trifolium pratense]|uniref:cyclic nucleotide-gated ion channel 1-like n=1 Tax=Trifolium pratense TaxID=57577 RepID=UPI001E69582F|nr:cyclic nucleotide-gated ion channel 1-like [Trifolium pratense]
MLKKHRHGMIFKMPKLKDQGALSEELSSTEEISSSKLSHEKYLSVTFAFVSDILHTFAVLKTAFLQSGRMLNQRKRRIQGKGFSIDTLINLSSNLPISTRTVQTIVEVEAFALKADDLKFVASQFRRLHSKQLSHTFRFYSQQWRTWATCFIQAAWRRYSKKKLEESLVEEENRLKDALAKASGSSGSLNALRLLRRSGTARKTRMSERIPAMLLQKPEEPDFTEEQ